MNGAQHVQPITTGFYDPTNDIYKEQDHIRKMLLSIKEVKELVL
jgi:hypothetical protein